MLLRWHLKISSAAYSQKYIVPSLLVNGLYFVQFARGDVLAELLLPCVFGQTVGPAHVTYQPFLW